MTDDTPTEWIVATEEARTLPAIELLTGRGFVTGKSGSGKSNSVSVIAEELLEAGYNMLVVDTEGEYFGLKERYELLHVGGDEHCDVTVGPEHATKIAEIALERNLPVILDVSAFLDTEEAETLVHDVVEELFVREGDLRKPFLLIVEEIQEYLPQSGGKDDLAKLLLRVAKRGRKRGLGICGISQRPSAVDKDMITQCDWMVWHRLTWETDVDVVRKILGSEIANEIPDLETGEAFLMTDWDESVERVRFRRKKTFDAGDTPGLQEFERPDLKTVGSELIQDLEADGATATGVPESMTPATEPSDGSADGGEDGDIDAGGGLAFEDDLDLLVSAMADPDPIPDDTDDLRNRLEQERKRNEILEAEVRELKRILRNVDTDAAGGTQTRRADTPEARGEPAIFGEPKRDGLVGALIEFGLLASYLGVNVARGVRRGVGRAVGDGSQARRREPIHLGRPRPDRRRAAAVGIGVLLLLVLLIVLLVVPL